jgi:hypothetical protein
MARINLNALKPSVSTKECFVLFDVCRTSDVALIVKGPPGCGKSSIARQTAMKRKEEARVRGQRYGYCELNLSLANLLDIAGHLALAHRDYDGHKIMAGEYSFPYFLYDMVDQQPAFLYSEGLLVVEEYGLGGPDEKKAIQSLVLDRRLGRYTLPDGWRVVLLSNRDTDRSGVTEDFDFCINRRMEVELKPDLDTWLAWADDNNLSYLTKAFVSVHQGAILNAEIPAVQGPFPTLRSIELADRHIAACLEMRLGWNSPLMLTGIAGLIGTDFAAKLKAYHEMGHELPKPSQIEADPRNCPMPTQLDQQYLVCHQLAARVTRDTIDAYLTYLSRFPKIYLMAFAASAKKLHPEIVNTVAWGIFSRNHLDLLAAAAAE